MAESWSRHPAPAASASTSVFLTTFAILLASIGALLVIDLWLAGIDARESRMHALHLFEDGQSLLSKKQPLDAADRFASAQSLERKNVRYGVALAEALLAGDRPNEAEAQLRAVLGHAETDGAANLVMARVLARENRPNDAIAFYHRAIYGTWNNDPVGSALRARLELIDLLVGRDAKRELLAELLPLQEVDADSVALRRRIAHLFVLAGSPARALPVFRELLKRDEEDGDAYAGMGEAALQLGNFRTAQADLSLATRLVPDSIRYASLLQVADTVLALDPLARGIGREARVQRARVFLQLTVDATAACSRGAVFGQLADSARVTLAAGALGAGALAAESRSSEDADPIVDLANDLWSTRDPRCETGDSPTMRALEILQNRLD